MKTQQQFGRVPSVSIQGGVVRAMTEADAKVCLVLCSHLDANWQAFPSVSRMSDLTGLTRRAIQKAVDRLAAIGLLNVEHGGGRGWSNTYTVRNSAPENGVSGCAVSSERAHADDRKRRTVSFKRAHVEGVNGAPRCAPTEGTERTDQQQGHGHVVAAAESPVVIALKNAGISEPTRSQLATTPGITAELIDEVDRSAKRRGKGTGIVVNEIREELERRRVEEECLARSQEYAAQEAERRQRQAAADKRIADEAEAWINKIEPSAIVAMFAELAAARDPSIPPVFWKNPPRDAQAIAKTYATPLFRRYGLGTPQGP